MIRAVAWDIDGTLVDSEPLHHASLMQVSARYGVEIARDDERFLGVAMEGVWEVLAAGYPPGLTREAWLEEIVEVYVGASDALQPFEGAHEAVAALARAGVRQGCVSNSVRRVVEANLALFDIEPSGEAIPRVRGKTLKPGITAGLDGFASLAMTDRAGPFEFALAREDVRLGKPDPEPYALACRRFGLSPHQVLAVEDSDTGEASARAAGLKVLRVGPGVFAEVVAQCTPLATPATK